MNTDPKHWLRLIITTPFRPEIKRNTKYYNLKQLTEKNQNYPISGSFTEYGNEIGQRMGLI
jgi:hypothetical protein